MTDPAGDRRQRRARTTAFVCAVLVAGMVGLSFAAVPLYRIFCQVTGYGGTTRTAEVAPGAGDGTGRMITVRFDANTSNDIPWNFRAVENAMPVRVGESALAFYRATNYSAKRTAGTATFNVTPLSAGQYFNKIDCFCFTEQALGPGQSADLPVSFFIDPAIEDDSDLDSVTTITLSYTYFAIEPDDTDTSLDAGAATGQSRIN